MDVQARVRDFVKHEVLFEDTDLTSETPLLNGMVDSMGLMRLVAFLEEEFDIEIDDTEITEDNFGTVADIARLVERVKQEA